MSNGVGGVNLSGVAPINIEGMDLETALLAVQSQRTQLLDQQMQVQIKEVQARNDQVARLNTVLSALNKATSQFAADAKPTDTIDDWGKDKIKSVEIPLNDAIRSAGIDDLGFEPRKGRISGGDEMGKVLDAAPNIMQEKTTKAELDAAVSKIKGMIDSVGNTQQMDMLRLQSMTGKRNEAFDVMTNFIKKGQDSKSSIIGNMR